MQTLTPVCIPLPLAYRFYRFGTMFCARGMYVYRIPVIPVGVPPYYNPPVALRAFDDHAGSTRGEYVRFLFGMIGAYPHGQLLILHTFSGTVCIRTTTRP